jgi:glutamate receptor ionotropic, NMDA 2B
MERLQKFWMAGACKKNEAKGEASKPLEVLNFTSAFILLACGMLLGSFLLLLEHVYFAFFRGRLRKCDTVGCCSLVSLVSFHFFFLFFLCLHCVMRNLQ